MVGDKRQQKMDVLDIIKEWFVMSKLFEDSDGSVLSYSSLPAQERANTGHSVIFDACGQNKERNLKSYLNTYSLSSHD